MSEIMYYIKWIQPFVDTPVLTDEQGMKWLDLSRAAYKARKWSDTKATPEQVIECSNKIKAMQNEMRTTMEG